MLVTFKTAAHGNITMFGDVARELLEMMGQSGNVPGALVSEDVAPALTELRTRLNSNSEGSAPPPLDDDDSSPAPVALSVRAIPLIELFEAAIAEKESIYWESN